MAKASAPPYHMPGYPVCDDWLALGKEEIILPDLPIVDPHHHLWHRQNERYLWPELLADLETGHNVRATVFVQCRSMYRRSGPEELRPLGEVEFVNGVAAMAANGFYGNRLACAGIVAGADLMLGDRLEPVLERMRGVAGDRFCGIRNSVAWHESPDVRASPILPPPGLMTDARFRDGVRRLGRRRLSLDVWCYQTQLGEAHDLAASCADTVVVINHLGGPLAAGPYKGRRDEMFAPWRAAIAKLARLPNTRIKLGGLGMTVGGFEFHLRPEPPSSVELADAWRPYVDAAIELFGVNRAMFESNFPVDKGMYGYAAFWNACKRLASGCSDNERTALFSGTAIAVYKLPAAEFMA